MGQKVNPISFRLSLTKDWKSRWFAARGEYGKLLQEDLKTREYIKERMAGAGIPRVVIERASNRIRIILHTSRPGIVIGRKGIEIDRLREELAERTGKEVFIDVEEIKVPEIEAQLVAENVALQLEHRVSFRRAMKKSVTLAMDRGAQGIKIACAGRLGGAEMSRSESYKEGKIPLHTLRADIDYGFAESRTTYGAIGVKVWVFKGERLTKKKGPKDAADAQKGEIQEVPARKQEGDLLPRL
jgi:small subunit ribosomal protein S3